METLKEYKKSYSPLAKKLLDQIEEDMQSLEMDLDDVEESPELYPDGEFERIEKLIDDLRDISLGIDELINDVVGRNY